MSRGLRVAVLAGGAGAVTWFVFGFESLLYSTRENGPVYYSFSDYVEYRNAPSEPIGVGYAVLTAALVIGAALAGRGRRVALALAAAGSIALPVAVPAALPRAEYGKDPVFHTPTSYEDPTSGRPVVCLAYGVQRIGVDPTTVDEPDLCFQLPDRSTAPRLVTGRPLVLDPDTPRRLAKALNESGIRPRDPLENIDLDGIEIVHATWSGTQVPQPAHSEPTNDSETKRQLERLARRLNACSAADGYAACTDIDALARAGIFVGEGSGQLTISAVTRNGYIVTGQSTSGTAFTISRERGIPAARFCAPSGSHGCSPRGRW